MMQVVQPCPTCGRCPTCGQYKSPTLGGAAGGQYSPGTTWAGSYGAIGGGGNSNNQETAAPNQLGRIGNFNGGHIG